MLSLTPDNLNQRFGIDGLLYFVQDRGPLIEAVIRSPLATARIALQGAQVLDFQPDGESPVIWTSHAARFELGRSVRGGIPVCWPWFGAHPDNLPAHGFARNRIWTPLDTAPEGDGVRIRFGLDPESDMQAMWPYLFLLRLEVHVARTLTLSLTTRNIGDTSFSLTQGLHTYLRVGDIDEVQVSGLEGSYYLDKVRGMTRDYQDSPLRFEGETDRIFMGTACECVISDPTLNRRIRVGKSGSHSTVVWNPGRERAGQFPDMLRDEYKEMVCVEATNAGQDIIHIPPGGQHTLETRIGVERLT
ncbi:MAG: D-hexose-6-phosphate mutarotase [Halothiobacillaceae bacterium]|jgi:D-hexose-6-phosphate mutarotase|nr:D-hexose-6-phosphate mutarotase [Halothiobacillaceae bacterium]